MLSLLSFAVMLGLGFSQQSYAANGDKPALTDADCSKCHVDQPAQIAAAGGKHGKVSCRFCHTSHRPVSKNNIPACNMCHSDTEHFRLKNCSSCHNNPHQPLNIKLPANQTDACLTCHKPQIQQLREHPSKHSALACSECHSVHRKKPECTQCHEPHAADMPATECTKCHKAHMPKVVTYADSIPNKDCGACHKPAFNQLAASKTKHQDKACAFCHKDKHRTVPTCDSCHGSPHPAGMMARFPKCGSCHNTAHNLNNWGKAKAAAAEGASGAKSPEQEAKPASKKAAGKKGR